MGKKPQHHTWADAKKLCRLNDDDIQMAKRLGFGPDSLIRARPNSRQKWKLPVKEWVSELHSERFGSVLRRQTVPAPAPPTANDDAEAARLFGEQLYWEDCLDRNSEKVPKPDSGKARAAQVVPFRTIAGYAPVTGREPSDDGVPF